MMLIWPHLCLKIVPPSILYRPQVACPRALQRNCGRELSRTFTSSQSVGVRDDLLRICLSVPAEGDKRG